MVAGTLFPSASPSNLTPSSSEKEFILRNGAGQVVARASAQSGNLYIKGSVVPSVSNLTSDSTKQELVIRNSLGQVVSLIDENGQMKLRGVVL